MEANVKYEELSATSEKFKTDSAKLQEMIDKYATLVQNMEWQGGAAEEARGALNQIKASLEVLKGSTDHLSNKAQEEVNRSMQADKEAYKDSNL